MVPTTLVLPSLVRDVGKELPRDEPIVCILQGRLTLSTSGNLASIRVCSGDTSETTIVPTCSPRIP